MGSTRGPRRAILILALLSAAACPVSRTTATPAGPPAFRATPIAVQNKAAPVRECESDDECAVFDMTADCSARDVRAVPRRAVSALERQRKGTPSSCSAEWAYESVAFCEDHRCTLHDAVEALAWAQARVPAMRKLSTLTLTSADAPWYTPDQHVVLYVRSDWLAPPSENADAYVRRRRFRRRRR